MSRTVTVSTAVFAAIWANRREGEETENAILSRMLGCGGEAGANETVAEGDGGVHDSRNNAHFPEGFEVFRNYKRREYKAIARQGVWLREDTGDRYPTLNQLNESIVSGNENVWNGNWKYRTPEGVWRSIDTLRS
ncbi:MAG: hypothetical protein OXE76_02735 [Alphaproteobacteria bacterium]|nr:hypothetical protein [Alphaproteobacteria bacterium]